MQNILGECSTLWGERERGSVVGMGVYVSSHRKLNQLGYGTRPFDMVAESTVSSSHQRSPCCDVPTIGQLHYTARAQATRKFTARPPVAVGSGFENGWGRPLRVGALYARAAYKILNEISKY